MPGQLGKLQRFGAYPPFLFVTRIFSASVYILITSLQNIHNIHKYIRSPFGYVKIL
ncbi:MAG: hypothetical protein K0S39_3815 [Paenibacillus sp.]|jgi:hypothetical protein|nr:hypothetical protein [Paenibacillus sp.]